MSVRSTLVNQFRCPHGLLGHLAGWTMALRPSNRERNRWAVELLQPQPGDRILEIGCGPGLALAACLAAHPTVSVVGLDHSELMIRYARRRNRAAVLAGRLHLVIGDLERLSLVGKGFTQCLLVNVAQFIPDRIGALKTIAKALEPNAVIAIMFQPRNPGAKAEDGMAFVEAVAKDLQEAAFAGAVIHRLDLKPLPAFCVVAENRRVIP